MKLDWRVWGTRRAANRDEARMAVLESFLCTMEFMRSSGELEEAGYVAVPWIIEDDPLVREVVQRVRGEALRCAQQATELFAETFGTIFAPPEVLEDRIARGRVAQEKQTHWLMDQLVSLGRPNSVLEYGTAVGDLTLELAKISSVTSYAPVPDLTVHARKIIEEDGLPVAWLREPVRVHDFADATFDHAIVLDYILWERDPVTTLHQLWDLTRRCLFLVVPRGVYRTELPHDRKLRCFSETAARALLHQASIPDAGVREVVRCESRHAHAADEYVCFRVDKEPQPALDESTE